MSAQPKAYRFAVASQWRSCLVHRFAIGQGLSPIRRFSSTTVRVGGARKISAVAASPGGGALARLDRHALVRLAESGAEEGPFTIDGALAAGGRWIVDRDGIWTSDGASAVHRYERESLLLDVAVELKQRIRDVASDGRGGIWALVEGPRDTLELIAIDCRGCRGARHVLGCDTHAPRRIANVEGGNRLVLLAGDGKWLVLVDPKTAAVDRVLSVGGLASCWAATELASDGRHRIALWGEQRIEGRPPLGLALVLAADGDVVDGPLMLSPVGRVNAVAVGRDRLWFGADSGLWQTSAADGTGARESDGTILTPALLSPDSDPTRGWLRAEVTVDLPVGAVLEAEYASTDDEETAARATQIAGDRSATTRGKQDDIWQMLEHPPGRAFRFTTPASRQSIAIPLFESRDRWLWIRLRLMAPPGASTGSISELRVLYPNQSIAKYLPAAFFGERKDPTGTMRRLVGVLESTTQQIDERIRGIGAHIDPSTAPEGWLDYLGRWMDLPWDDELPVDAKRRVLANGGELLAARGTRRGIQLLLSALLGAEASVRITDLTVDHAVAVVGGAASPGATLPTLLAGTVRTPTLGGKAIVGRACLNRNEHPLDAIVPRVHISVRASPAVRRAVAPLLERVLLQYLPAGVGTLISWAASSGLGGTLTGGGIVLDGEGPGRVGGDGTLGRVRLAGRKDRLTDTAAGIGLRLR
jgi:phage tail-like protein